MGAPADIPTQGLLNSVKSIASLRGRLSTILQSIITWQDLVLEARGLLGDEGLNGCPIRYPDEMLLNGLNRGLQELARIRPDSMYDRYAGNDLNVPEISDTAGPGLIVWTDAYELNRVFWPPLVYYVVGSADLAEDEYSQGDGRHPHGSRAAGSLRLFRKHVLSV